MLTEDPTSTTELRLGECLEPFLERVRTDDPDATVDLDASDGADVVARCPSTFPIAVADVVEHIVASNSGPVHVEVTVTRDRNGHGSESALVVIDDDADGLPEVDVQAIEEAEKETPLSHAEGLSLWPLQWTVKRAGGELCLDPEGATAEIRLPRPD